VFSRSPTHLDIARRELRVGNLYLNRAITGAVVGRQPFGGLKLSGAGWKAGGADYLKQFLESRTIAENTLRTGSRRRGEASRLRARAERRRKTNRRAEFPPGRSSTRGANPEDERQ